MHTYSKITLFHIGSHLEYLARIFVLMYKYMLREKIKYNF